MLGNLYQKLGPKFTSLSPSSAPDYTPCTANYRFEQLWAHIHSEDLRAAADEAAGASLSGATEVHGCTGAPSWSARAKQGSLKGAPLVNLATTLLHMAQSKLFAVQRHETGDSDDLPALGAKRAADARQPWHLLVIYLPLPGTVEDLEAFIGSAQPQQPQLQMDGSQPLPSSQGAASQPQSQHLPPASQTAASDFPSAAAAAAYATSLDAKQRTQFRSKLSDVAKRLVAQGVRVMLVDTGVSGPLSRAVSEALAASLEAPDPAKGAREGSTPRLGRPLRPWVLPLAQLATADPFVSFQNFLRGALKNAPFPLPPSMARAAERPVTLLSLGEGRPSLEVNVLELTSTSYKELTGIGPLRVEGRAPSIADLKLEYDLRPCASNVLVPRPSARPDRAARACALLQSTMIWLATQQCSLRVRDEASGRVGVIEPLDALGRKGLLAWYHADDALPLAAEAAAAGTHTEPAPSHATDTAAHLLTHLLSLERDAASTDLLWTADLRDIVAAAHPDSADQVGSATDPAVAALLQTRVLPFSLLHRAMLPEGAPRPREIMVSKSIYPRNPAPFPGLLSVLPKPAVADAPRPDATTGIPRSDGERTSHPPSTSGAITGPSGPAVAALRFASEAYRADYAQRRAQWSEAAARTARGPEAPRRKTLAEDALTPDLPAEALLEEAKGIVARLVAFEPAAWASFVVDDGRLSAKAGEPIAAGGWHPVLDHLWYVFKCFFFFSVGAVVVWFYASALSHCM